MLIRLYRIKLLKNKKDDKCINSIYKIINATFHCHALPSPRNDKLRNNINYFINRSFSSFCLFRYLAIRSDVWVLNVEFFY